MSYLCPSSKKLELKSLDNLIGREGFLVKTFEEALSTDDIIRDIAETRELLNESDDHN
jgi:hypothetical protein